jgi:hypothetical protein
MGRDGSSSGAVFEPVHFRTSILKTALSSSGLDSPDAGFWSKLSVGRDEGRSQPGRKQFEVIRAGSTRKL